MLARRVTPCPAYVKVLCCFQHISSNLAHFRPELEEECYKHQSVAGWWCLTAPSLRWTRESTCHCSVLSLLVRTKERIIFPPKGDFPEDNISLSKRGLIIYFLISTSLLANTIWSFNSCLVLSLKQRGWDIAWTL